MEGVRTPADLTLRAWWHAIRDAAKGFRDRNLADRAAALTYYSILSVFPALIVLISLLGVLGTEGTVDRFLGIIGELGPESAVETLRGPAEDVIARSGAASVALGVGLLVALYSASGYIGAFMRTANEIYAVEDERPFWKRRPLQLAITLAMVVVLAVVLVALVLTGPVAEAIGAEFGIGDTAITVYSIVKWPLLFAVVAGVIALLYRVSADVRHQGLGWILPGGLLATVLWLLASLGFTAYVANFGSYANTYGGLASVVVFLIWLWLTNIAVVFGAQFARELERTGGAARSGTEREFASLPERGVGGEDEDEAYATGTEEGAAGGSSDGPGGSREPSPPRPSER